MYFHPCIGSSISSFITTASGGPTLAPRVKIVAKKSPSCQPANHFTHQSSDSKVATTCCCSILKHPWKHVDPRWPLMILWKSTGTHPMPRFTQEIASRLKGLTTILPYRHWGGTLRLDSRDLSWSIRTEFIILETTVKCKYTSGHIRITLLNLKLWGFGGKCSRTKPTPCTTPVLLLQYHLCIFLQLHPSRWMFPKIVVPPNHPF